jgi:voltage-dependent calcium channel T type alpha-1G
MIFFIAINTIEIALDNPLNDPSTKFVFALYIVDYIMTCIFSIEILIKIIANGIFFNGERSFFRSYLNFLDIIVVIVTVRKNIFQILF